MEPQDFRTPPLHRLCCRRGGLSRCEAPLEELQAGDTVPRPLSSHLSSHLSSLLSEEGKYQGEVREEGEEQVEPAAGR